MTNFRKSILCFMAMVLLVGYKLPPASDSPVGNNSSIKNLQELSKSISGVAKVVSPAVVFVSISKIAQARPSGYIDPFEYFFGPGQGRTFGGQGQPDNRPQKAGVGSGFIIDLDRGYIATSNHVIEGADEISLKLANGETYDGNVVGRDKRTDIAVVEIKNKKFNRKGLAAMTLGDSDKLEIGEFVIALGAPFELEASLSFGVVSALQRDVQLGGRNNVLLGNFIQTDAAINPGNSGGPLINMQGQAIGINTAIYSTSGGYNGIGFAVPSNLIRRVIEEIINKGNVSRGYLGVVLQNVDKKIARDFGLPDGVNGGALITNVAPDGPAKVAGFKSGDVVVEVDGKKILSDFQLMNTVGLSSPGQVLKIGYFREGKKNTVAAKIDNFPSDEQIAKIPVTSDGGWFKGGTQDSGFGMTLAPINPSARSKFLISSKTGALVVETKPNSPAARTGLRPGDAILGVAVNAKQFEVANPEDFNKHTKGQSRVMVRIERQGKFFFVELSK